MLQNRKINSGEDLKDARRYYNLSVQKLAEHTGISVSLLQKIERNARNGSDNTWKKINDFFNTYNGRKSLIERIIDDGEEYGNSQQVSLELEAIGQEYMTFAIRDYSISSPCLSNRNDVTTTIKTLKDIFNIYTPFKDEEITWLGTSCGASLESDLFNIDEVIIPMRFWNEKGDENDILNILLEQCFIEKSDFQKYHMTILGAFCIAKRFGDFPEIEENAISVNEYDESYMVMHNIKPYTFGILSSIPQVASRLALYTYKRHPDIEINDIQNIFTQILFNICLSKDMMYDAGIQIDIYPDEVKFFYYGREKDGLPEKQFGSDVLIPVFNTFIKEANKLEHCLSYTNVLLASPVATTVGKNQVQIVFKLEHDGRLSKEEKVHICYSLACECTGRKGGMTAADVLTRFHISKKNAAIGSRIIKDTLEAGMIKISNPEAPAIKRLYVPYWWNK